MSVFKDYDLRGVYPSEIDEKFAFRLGRAYAEVFKPQKVFVGQDCRLSSDILANEFIHGLIVQGVNVVDIGLCSTPMLYFAGKYGDAVMITASHNPPKYNGFKICKGGRAIGYSTGLRELEASVTRKFTPKKPGSLRRKDLMEDYVNHVLSFAGKIRQSRVVVDAGNGMAGLTAPEIFRRLPVKVIPLFFEMDGRFPNRNPNPILTGALKKLGKAVRKNKADAGFAYDGDCDRLVIVDEKGKVVRPYALGALLAGNLKQNSKVVVTPFASIGLINAIKENKCKGVMSKVGHTNVSNAMKKHNAEFGAEYSGHYFFKKNFYLDSGDIAAVKALSLLGRKPLSELASRWQKTFVIEKELSLKKGLMLIRKLEKEKGKHLSIDGVRVDFAYGWICARKSNTEPVVRVVGEAVDRKGLKKLESLI